LLRELNLELRGVATGYILVIILVVADGLLLFLINMCYLEYLFGLIIPNSVAGKT
jgi:hypothetical protein